MADPQQHPTLASASQSSIPIIVCGKSPQIVAEVKSGLAPDYEVIHHISNPTDAKAQLPHLLSSQELQAKAVVIGGAFSDEEIEDMREACASSWKEGEGTAVPWLKPDQSIPTPSSDDVVVFGVYIVERTKRCLDTTIKEGSDKEQEKGLGDVKLY